MKAPRFKFNPLIIALYMLPALAWWAHLLWKSNEALYQKEVKLLLLQSKVSQHEELIQLPAYQKLTAKMEGKRKMVIGEGVTFFLVLLAGLWYVYRSYQRERNLAKRQHQFQLSITHELKTPITSMQLVFDTLKRHDQLQPGQVHKMAESGKRESVRLMSLVNDILLSGQLETEWKPALRDVQIEQVLNECIRSAQVLYPETKYEVALAAQAQQMTCDEQGLHHICMNLIENASKYSPKGSTVRIESTNTAGKVSVRVADQGIGVGLADREHIFEKFYRGGNEDTRETKGTGLGLFVVKQIVTAHKGQIAVRSNTPKGTVFEFSL
jgi:two-component system, OmpR family, phosphate regulon sensor histidine kinase PhoR